MHLSTTLSIRPRAAAPAKPPPPTSSSTAAARAVPGAVLALAVVVGRRHLLFLTDDVPFEELLTVLLLGADLRPRPRHHRPRRSGRSVCQPRLIPPRGWSLPSAATAPGPSKCSTPPGCGFRLCPTPRA
jgi:hypothetical protein